VIFIKLITALAFVAAICASNTTPASARTWKTTSVDLAREFAIIDDQRTPQELVRVIWLTPKMVPLGQGSVLAKELLTDYLVIGIIHLVISEGGNVNYPTIISPIIELRGRGALPPTAIDALNPEASKFIVAIQEFMSKSFGEMGEGMHWSIYNGDGIDSCRTGEIIVPYDGERYNYNLPIPGC
jgi:hypothetical protein